ncbi:MAG TPA: helix-turn-helix transcriptional regulator [Coleofasciculaceae cyanobacterium]
MVSSVKVRRIQKIEVDVPELPELLKQALKGSGKSVSTLCLEVEISRTYWYQLTSGKEDAVSEDTLRKIESALGTSFNVNFGGDRND